MTTDLVEKCAIAASLADNYANDGLFAENYRNIALAVIDALADGVTPEMWDAFWHTFNTDWDGNESPHALSAAIRAAKSREG